MTFYEGSQFPAEFKGDAFACEHGSWNRAKRAGYEVIRLPMHDGHSTGEYEDFSNRVHGGQRRWRCVGTASGSGGGAGWVAVRLGRRVAVDLARGLHRQVNSGQWVPLVSILRPGRI